MNATRAADIYSDLNLPTASLPVTIIFVLVSLQLFAIAGFIIGKTVRNRNLQSGKEIDFMAGETTLGAFLAMFGLLLAFAFGNALNYFNERKEAMTLEANALGTAFLRADVLDEEIGRSLQRAILDYAETRITTASDPSLSEVSPIERLDQSLQLQAKLWPKALEATADPVPPATQSFVLSAINDVLDAHLVRAAKLSIPISKFANGMMFVSALAAVFLLGNRLGMTGRSMTWRTYLFTGFVTVVMITIIDTQRATEGFVRIDETPIRAAIFDMEGALNG